MDAGSAHDVDRLVYYVARYDFAKKCMQDCINNTYEFGKHEMKENFIKSLANCKLWDGICDTWINLARREKCYVVDDL